MIRELAVREYDASELSARPASGSSRWQAMVILPCTMGTLGAIANGISLNLIHRSADCFLKQRRPVIAVIRETPLNLIHLKNMLRFSEAGGIVYPAMPAFYSRPGSIDEMARFFAARIAEFLGFIVEDMPVWEGI
jgi:4-hydroxy-3-polyprenylbenzoate decarboxylase